MKRTIFHLSCPTILFLLVVGGASSCKMSDEESFPVEGTTVSSIYHASIEQAGDSQTKVYVDNAFHVLWNADDRITIFPKYSRNKQYRFTGSDGASGGDFEEVEAGYGTGTEIAFSYGVYPYNENTTYVFDDIIRTSFPKEQFYRQGSFGLNTNLMVAKSATSDLSFKNVGGYLCLQLYGEGISVRSIILQGNKGETLSGPVKVSFGEGNIPVMEFDSDDPTKLESEIILKTSSPVALGSSESEAVVFWMVVPPRRFQEGFTITVIDSQGGVHEKKTTKDISIERNKQTLMTAFEVVEEAQDPLPSGIHPLSGEDYTYEKTTDQENIYEAEGKAWVRYLLIPTLTMYEIGPIPTDVVAGTTFVSNVKTFVNGYETGSLENCSLTVQSLESGMMNLVSDEGVRYVFRF